MNPPPSDIQLLLGQLVTKMNLSDIIYYHLAKDLKTGSVLSIFYMLCFALLPEKESFQSKRLHLSLNLSFST